MYILFGQTFIIGFNPCSLTHNTYTVTIQTKLVRKVKREYDTEDRYISVEIISLSKDISNFIERKHISLIILSKD